MRRAATAAGLVAGLSLAFILVIDLLPAGNEGDPAEIYDILALVFWAAILVLLFIGVIALIRRTRDE